MNEEEGDGLKQAIDEQVRDRLPAIQKAIQVKTGKQLNEGQVMEIVGPTMLEVVHEVTHQATHYYQGPMPSPQVMRGYADIYPGAPDVLFEQFQREQAHRHKWENDALARTAEDQKRKDLGAYTVAVVGILGACYLAYLGALSAAAILIGAIVLGGGALVLGRQFIGSWSNDGGNVAINHDGNSHHDVRSQRTSQKTKGSGSRRN